MANCAKQDFNYQPIGEACPDCGHTNVLHPGPHNPSLDECLVCRLVTLREDETT